MDQSGSLLPPLICLHHQRRSLLFSVNSAATLDRPHPHSTLRIPAFRSIFSFNPSSPLHPPSHFFIAKLFGELSLFAASNLCTPPPTSTHSLASIPAILPSHLSPRSAVTSRLLKPVALAQSSSFSAFQEFLTQLIILFLKKVFKTFIPLFLFLPQWLLLLSLLC